MMQYERKMTMDLQTIIPLIVGGVILIAVMIYLIINQKNKVKEWLLYAVCEAEKLFGRQTGKLKLRQVYDWFCAKFPVVSAILPFTVFSAWVDVALTTMRKWLETNVYIEGYIKGGE